MTDSLTLRVEMTPPQKLTPNARQGRWATKDDRNAFKMAGAVSVLEALRGHEWKIEGSVSVDVAIYWQKGRMPLDFDNAVASLKHCVDAIFTKLGMNDRQIRGMTLKQSRDPALTGYMVITIAPFEEKEVA